MDNKEFYADAAPTPVQAGLSGTQIAMALGVIAVLSYLAIHFKLI